MLRHGFLLSLSILLAASNVFGQSSDWQQNVDYWIDVHLQTDRHRLEGTERITYYNNSPDTLHKIYLHLYYNAFQPHSMMAERNRELPDPDDRVVPRIFNLGPEEIGEYEIKSLTQEGVPLTFDIFDTVLSAPLARPLAPGDSTQLDVDFSAQVPLLTRRGGRDNREGIDFSMSQWYPKVAQYDEDGWHPDPYVGREFYAPFGSFDVRITLPSQYLVGATGQLQNPEEIGHGYDTDRTTGPAVETDSLTWRFAAENVHDFAWAADPDFIHDRFEGPDNTQIHLLYQPDVADTWQRMHEWVPEIMRFYSQEYGPYPYAQFTAIQAGDGGMEYPQIVFLTGRRSPQSLRGVTAHEVAHQWFYGVLATNEADYAWMDEGFTTYADTEVAHHLNNRPGAANHLNSYLNVIYTQKLELFERLNTPSDWFETNLGYGIAAYPGGAMVVDMLGGVISDSLRDRWLKEYYRQYQFRHPQPKDIERLAEEVSGLRLDWFFEQWTNMTRTCDYAASDLTSTASDNGYATQVTIRRKTPIVMPVDVRLTMDDGTRQWVHIPLGISRGHKPVNTSWVVAEPWSWTNPDYTLELTTESPVVEAEVDPRANLPDHNRLNNSTSFPLDATFLQPPGQSYVTYPIGWRPSLHYAGDWGPGLGLQVRGRYLFNDHRLHAGVKLWPQILASGGDDPAVHVRDPDLSITDGFNYVLSYHGSNKWLGPQTELTVDLQNQLGIVEHRIGVSKRLDRYPSLLTDRNRRLTVELIHQHRYSDRSFGPGNTAIFWPDEQFLWTEVSFRTARQRDFLELSGRLGTALGPAGETPFGTINYNTAVRLRMHAQQTQPLGPVQARLRLSAGWGLKRLGFQQRFRLSSVPLEDAWRSSPYRSMASATDAPVEDAHLSALPHAGPVAYIFDSSFIGGSPIGRQKVAATLTVDHRPFRATSGLSPLTIELFSGIGTVWNETNGGLGDFLRSRIESFKADTGVGVAYAVNEVQALQRWTGQSSVLQNLSVAAKFPFWVSDPGSIGDKGAAGFRWMLGVQIER
jgi:hypothetical protein